MAAEPRHANLPISDASSLALLAEYPGMPEEAYRRLLQRLATKAARDIAAIIRGEARTKRGLTSGAQETADAIKRWASSNRIPASSS